jgi:hypothetical protein
MVPLTTQNHPKCYHSVNVIKKLGNKVITLGNCILNEFARGEEKFPEYKTLYEMEREKNGRYHLYCIRIDRHERVKLLHHVQ